MVKIHTTFVVESDDLQKFQKMYGPKSVSKKIRELMRLHLFKEKTKKKNSLSEEMKEMFRINPDFGKRKTNMEISR